jgi:branched-chain amino acid aminotransferase
VTATWWIDGTVVPTGRATIAADDHGLVVGDGVFETLKVEGGTPFAVGRHLARLRRSASALGIEVPHDDEKLRAAMAQTVAASGLRRARLRLTVTGGPGPLTSVRGEVGSTVVIGMEPLPDAAEVARVAVAPWCRNERGATAGIKTTSYAENVIALAWARRRDADEAILANTCARLCEGTGSNVFVVTDGRVLTPPLSAGCLAGITRSLLLDAGVAEEADLPLEALSTASEAFLTSTTRDVQPISAVDGRPLPVVGGCGTTRAAAAFAQLSARSSDP